MASKNVQLPELGEGVTEGELVKWLVKVGDKISPDQPVAEMMTDKATVEVPSPIAGTVTSINKKEGDVIEVGAVMLVVETDGAGASAPAAKAEPAKAPAAAPAAAKAPAAQPAAMSAAPAAAKSASTGMDVYPPVADAKVLATPATRRLARESGVDLNQVRGTGVAGRVTRDDVLGGAGATAAGAPSYGNAAGGVSALQIPRPGIRAQRARRKSVCHFAEFAKKLQRTCRWRNTSFLTSH